MQKNCLIFEKVGKGMPSVNEIVGALYDKGWDIPIIGNVATIFKGLRFKRIL